MCHLSRPICFAPKTSGPLHYIYIDNIQINDTIRVAKTRQILGFINEASQSVSRQPIAVEMTWALGPEISADQLEH